MRKMKFFDKISNVVDAFNPANFQVVDRKEFNRVYGNYESMLKTHDSLYLDSNSRPSLSIPYLDTPSGSKIPTWILSPIRIYDMAEQIGDLRVVFEAIQREMFKNGEVLRPKFKYKCNNCLKTFKNKPTKKFVPIQEEVNPKDTGIDHDELECDECGNKSADKGFSMPDPKNRVKLQGLKDMYVNNNEQKLIDVGRQFERDLDIIDQGYALFTKRYFIKPITDASGKEISDPVSGATHEVDESKTQIDEIIRLSPVQMTMIANSEGRLGADNNNNPAWICPNYEHRTERLAKPVCNKCGCRAFTAVVESSNVPFALPVADPKKMMYAKSEIIWVAGKYVPDLLYGHSPILSIWRKCLALFHQDEYIWKYFDKDRPPKSLLVFGSRNYESVQAFMERQKQGAKGDPYMPRPITLNTEDIGKAVQFIDLTPNFKELELTELRKELRQVILTLYGVTPIYAGEQQGSGLGNQGLQVTLTNRAVKLYQKFFNEKFFNAITEKIYGVYDWEIALIEAEEIDLLREEQIKGTKIDNASKLYTMGFDIWTDGNDELQHSQFPNPERQAMMMAGDGKGSNQNKGDPNKTKNTQPKGEEKTNFGGEPLLNRPSDKGGDMQGSSQNKFSYSQKNLDMEGDMSKVVSIVEKGLANNWTMTHIANEVSKELGISDTQALDIVKYMYHLGVESSMKTDLNKKIKKYKITNTDDGAVVEVE